MSTNKRHSTSFRRGISLKKERVLPHHVYLSHAANLVNFYGHNSSVLFSNKQFEPFSPSLLLKKFFPFVCRFQSSMPTLTTVLSIIPFN